ncbi:MAG: DUF1446 domain-containing protein [Gemmataceae bacterium]|nr:DUF1446 domain-containing protein [Gemmataceae bacterium]
MDKVRIGNACGFWGDDPQAPAHLATGGNLDFLTLEYLAELTMSILAHQKAKNPQAGYAGDFITVLQSLILSLKAQPRLKMVTNAGGMNPLACAKKAKEVLDQAGIVRRIGYLTGDDLLDRLPDFIRQGIALENLDDGRPLEPFLSRVVSANAYLGSEGIVQLLEQGAEIVITGRVADACLTVGPAAWHFQTPLEDWNTLAGFSVAGHLIECGAQVTGGNFTRWQEVPRYESVGYPIAEISSDGSFLLTKPQGTGGLVNFETVAEQLLYEVGDPSAYLTPDVSADFTSVEIQDIGSDRVQVGKAKGRPKPPLLKVSLAYRDGFMASGTLVAGGGKAREKAECCGQIIREKLRQANALPQEFLVEILGAGDSLPGIYQRNDPPEAVLRLAARDPSKGIIERFTREFAPLVTSGPQGITGYTSGRPQVREVFRYWPTTIPRDLVPFQLGFL